MVKTTLVLVMFTTVGVFNAVDDFHKGLPIPVEITKEDPRLTDTRETLKILGRDPKYAKAIYVSATAKNIDPVLWACNIECESEYNIKAKSSMGYKGLGQTPRAAMKTGFEEADLMYAACTFDEKMQIAKGDTHKAMSLYKGGLSPAAKRDAAKVFALFEKVKSKLKEHKDA